MQPRLLGHQLQQAARDSGWVRRYAGALRCKHDSANAAARISARYTATHRCRKQTGATCYTNAASECNRSAASSPQLGEVQLEAMSEVHWEALSLSTGGCKTLHQTCTNPHLSEVHGEAIGVPQSEGIAARQLTVLGACTGGVGRGSSSMVGRWKRPACWVGQPEQTTAAITGGPLVELLQALGPMPCIPIDMPHTPRCRTETGLLAAILWNCSRPLTRVREKVASSSAMISLQQQQPTCVTSSCNDLPATQTKQRAAGEVNQTLQLFWNLGP